MMKDIRMSPLSPTDAVVETLTLRYRAAFARYQGLVRDNTALSLSGGRPSVKALLAEEEAFEDLDGARHALLDAAARANPSIH
jgi:hypothetical protein